MQCPVDGTELTETRYEGKILVDGCRTCRGMWLDHGELEQILETHERHHADALARQEDYYGETVEVARQRQHPVEACPHCGAEMERREYGANSGVLIDACIKGCGIWLDRHEIEALEVFYERLNGEAHEERRPGFIRRFFALLDRD
jgi:Zn-finger nucleic acid-binding protein